MKVSRHNKDILKLIDQGFDDNEIRSQIMKKHGIHLELSKINSKRKSELNDFIKPFLKDSKELLYPILYKGFPNRNNIREKIDQIIYYLIDSIDIIKDFPSEKALEDLQVTIEKGLNTYKHDAFLYKLIYQHKNIYSKDFEDAKEISLLKSLLSDPFKNFFDLCNMNMKHISFAEESTDFDHIIREVCRDNIITKTERLYLEEKAKEYFIDSNKLKRYLDNPFFGYETFKIFVDQICEDGIITDTESKYINEKASQYNVPKELLEKMISTGLMRAKFGAQLSQNKDFYDIVLIYLFASAFGLKSVQEILARILNIDRYVESISDLLETEKEVLFDAFCKAVNEKKELEALQIESANTIQEVFSRLNMTTIPLGNILYANKNNSVSLPKLDNVTKQNEVIYSIDGYTFEIHEVSQEMGPLFWCKTEGLHQNIYINESHPKYEFYSSESFKQVLIALGRSSLSFTDSSGDIFFNRMKNYIELIN